MKVVDEDTAGTPSEGAKLEMLEDFDTAEVVEKEESGFSSLSDGA